MMTEQQTQEQIVVDNAANRFLIAANSGDNCFLTGGAGTGKSYLLSTFLKNNPAASVTASTALAALPLGGTTLHRFCGMQQGPTGTETFEECAERLRQTVYPSPRKAAERRVETCECLVIDEISMLTGRVLDFTNWLFKDLRGCSKPFGGCPVVVCGDFLQLPPVTAGHDEPDWAFNSEAWKEAGFESFVLTHVRRQADPGFQALLAACREGHLSDSQKAELKGRSKVLPHPTALRLFPYNYRVDRWNEYKLGMLSGEIRAYAAGLYGPGAGSAAVLAGMRSPAILELKQGARVTVTANTRDEHGLPVANGETGTVLRTLPRRVAVLLDRGGIEIELAQHRWSMSDGGASVMQIPLRLAYAMTIHKAQGLTLDAVHASLQHVHEPGQAYVALSRVRTLDGLTLQSAAMRIEAHQRAVDFYRDL